MRSKLRILTDAVEDMRSPLAGDASRSKRVLRSVRRLFLPFYFNRPPRIRIRLRALNPRRATPNFAAIGPVRSGTTFLAMYLFQHPCVVLPLCKELVAGRYREFNAQFPTITELRKAEQRCRTAITGFCSPVVPSVPWACAMRGAAPDLKIIIILRNPVDRLYSQWTWDERWARHQLRKDRFWMGYPNLEEAVAIELQTVREGGTGLVPMSGYRSGGYLQHGIYAPFVKTLISFFGSDKLNIVTSEEFFTDPSAVARRLYEFLELPDYLPTETHSTNSLNKSPLASKTRQLLADFYRPHNEALYALLGRDLGWDI